MARWVARSGADWWPGCSTSWMRWWRRCVLPQKSVSDLRAVDVDLGHHVVRYETSSALRLAEVEAVSVFRTIDLHHGRPQI